jgi:hypothetical protein
MTDFTLSITDPDALDAIDHIIQANGTGEKPEDVIKGMVEPQLVAMRGQQIENAAADKAKQDPDILAFQARQEAKIAAKIEPALNPVVIVQP